jgi:DNA-directed RNA polymerase subunit beta
VKDTSLRVPPGVEGTVIDAKVFSRRGIEKDDRTRSIEDDEIAMYERNMDEELRGLGQIARERIAEAMAGRRTAAPLKRGKQAVIAKGAEVTAEMVDQIRSLSALEGVVLEDEAATERVHEILDRYREQVDRCRETFDARVSRFEKGDDLPPGVIKMVKVYVAMKRKLSVGDKMAGRHGNKGVVSRILPQEDMPYFADGRSVDMVLNPLGVPSRMNVGQILEIHLGRAARGLGAQLERLVEARDLAAIREKFRRIFTREALSGVEIEDLDAVDDAELAAFAGQYREGVHMATPVFDGAKEEEIKALLEEAGLERSAQTTLYDGRTGEPFREKITVGTMYMLKLHHLVDDKIHARSIGPYSLVTQQPLGGKAQFGGQRLGEMEVWAMEAYGAAHALQEFLTVKSDDMAGRTRMYEKIVKGQNVLEPGIPESFKVLTKELQALGLDVGLMSPKDFETKTEAPASGESKAAAENEGTTAEN